MRIVGRLPLVVALVLATAVGGCGATAAPRARNPAPAVIATSASTTNTVLPFTQLSGADVAFAKRLDKRCRARLAALRRLAPPTTLLDQAAYSQRELAALSHLLSALVPSRAPADMTKAMSSYQRAAASEMHADEFVIDAANAQNGEGVAYWLSRRAAARSAMTDWSGVLDAPGCAP